MNAQSSSDEKFLEGEAVGQNEPRWRRLRGLIDRYPGDSGILKELIQNADDGQARRVEIILDETDYSSEALHDPALGKILGPAIIAYNDKPFEDSDFTNLENLANSAKIEDAFKTGRFGLGFNSVYNVTDYPILLTAGKLWCLDPCETLFKRAEGGMRWKLNDILQKGWAGFLQLFTHTHYTPGETYFNGTALRLPLRNRQHVALNQDISAETGKARISTELFVPDTYLELVEGLAKIGHELLLFLKNVEAVTCSRIHSDGHQETLLEIAVENSEHTRKGREVVNKVIRSGKLAEVISACSQADNGKIEACFRPRIRVLLPNGLVETSSWQIVSGLYAGQNDALVKASEELTIHGERGLPHAGVAVCLEKNGQTFPQTIGKVFCYLPIADKDYSGKLPIHIHGAFSLDDSRTSLTSHREDEQGKSAARANWNDLLMGQASASAYAAAIVEVIALEVELGMTRKELAAQIYRLFPAPPSERTSLLKELARAAYLKLASEAVFLDVHDDWEPTETLYELPEDTDLRESLRLEGFSFAFPLLPPEVQKGLSEVNLDPQPLTAADLIEHFREKKPEDEKKEWEIVSHPFAGLRNREQLMAVVRFLIGEETEDWCGLPLALCLDGKVHCCDNASATLIATPRQAEILAFCLERVIDLEIAELLNRMECVPSGFAEANAETWLKLVKEFLETDEDNHPELNSSEGGIPNRAWLLTIFQELNALDESMRPSKECLHAVPLIPDSAGQLWNPGNKGTPLLLELRETSMGELLDSVDVAYFVLSPSPLSSALRSFAEGYGRVGFLKASDLIDSLHGRIDELDEIQDDWGHSDVVDPLLRFLETNWTGEKLDEDSDRIRELGELPFFEDRAGDFGPCDDSCFVPGAFDVPANLTGLRLLKMSSYPKLQSALGVRELSRLNLLKHWLLPNFTDLAPEARWQWLRWIRDEWYRLLGEIGGGLGPLRDLLIVHPIIPTVSGVLVEPENCYHPVERDFIVSVIGDRADFPAVSIDGEEGPLWSEFFDHLALSRSPDTQDIADQIWQWVDHVKAEGLTSESRMGLIQLAKHLFNNWEQHREESVITPGEDENKLSTVLRDLEWLPAASAEELQDYFASKEAEQLLYSPGKLIPFQQGRLVGSVRGLLPRQLVAPSSLLQEDLDIHFKPEWEDVAAHFENVLDAVGEGPFTTQDLELLKPSLKAIYRFFGENAQRFGGSDEEVPTDNPVAKRFACRKCILVPQQRRFYLPSDVYRSCPRQLEPIKFKVSAKDSTIDKGYDVFGRSECPGIDDLGRSLVNLSDSFEGCLESDLAKAVNSVLRHLGELVSEDELDELPQIAVLNALDELVDPSEVLEANDFYLQENLHVERGLLLHPDTPVQIIHSWRIRGLRDAEIRPVVYAPATDEDFLQQCRAAAGIIHSSEFCEGIRRLFYHSHGAHLRDSERMFEFRIEPSSGLECAYAVQLGGERLDLGRAPAEFCFREFEDAQILLIDQGCHDVFFERVAEALCALLCNLAPIDRVALVKVLQQENPNSIGRVLDRLHIRRLQEGSAVVQKDAAHCDDDYFGEDTEKERVGKEVSLPEEIDPASDVGDNDAEHTSTNEDSQVEEIVNGNDENVPGTGNELVGSLATDRRRGTGGPLTSPAGVGGAPRGGSGRSAGPRGRMLPGARSGVNSFGQKRTGTGGRQQNALWISRPKPELDKQPSAKDEDDDHDDDHRSNHPIGKAAVGLVLAYERSQGRKAQNMAHANPGYDIESKAGRLIDRYIEVKGIDSEWGVNGVPLSSIQFKHAQEKGDQFWLYVVENARDPDNARIHMIQNPFGKVNQHRFDHGWKSAAETVQMKGLPQPQKGKILVVLESDGSIEKEGPIIDVRENENQIDLQVRFEKGEPAKNVVFDPTYMIVRPS